MPIIPKMPIIPIMPEIPEMPIMPPRGMGGEKLANLKISKCGGLEDSEGNGEVRKRRGSDFGEKKV